MKLYNTLTRKVEEFKPMVDRKVKLYTCGPTVYYYPQIGNWRTFVFYDVLRRVLEYNGYWVNQVMNATDVGHLTGDNMGDADTGEDRMEKAAKKEGKTAWEIAEFYIQDFVESTRKLNIEDPTHFVRATDNISEQIELIKQLEKNGLTYQTTKGVYFNVLKFPKYGQLGGQKMVDKRVATREELIEDNQKKSPQDFALWKFSKPEDKRQMEWNSPWGVGFPGWHLECSTMAMKYLGETIDIHAGGIDHIAIHHTNEIAQSEGATGKTFSRFWLHGEFLTVDGGRMGKSLGNAYTLHDVIAKGFDPLALRYLYLTAHYRTKLNFTWEALQNAQNALEKLRYKFRSLATANRLASRDHLSREQEFLQAINSDLNMPEALAIAWQTENPDSLLKFDKVLGLGLDRQEGKEVPEEIRKLLEKREELRREKKFTEADQIRQEIEAKGYPVKDKKS
jgi:cysteinyl-tRNA synthetase